MRFKQPASQRKTILDTPNTDEFEKLADAKIAGSKAADPKPVEGDVSFVITEILRGLIDQRIDKKPRSRFEAISNNPLIVGVVGVIGVLIGGFITAIYTSQQKFLEHNLSSDQQELARQRSFSDELNKISIQKLGEVWERIDENELAIDNLLNDSLQEAPNMGPKSNIKRLDEIRNLIHEDKVILSKNRFWIGEELYDKAGNYLDLSVKYALNKFIGGDGIDLSELIKEREAAKQDILQIRRFFVEDGPNRQPMRMNK